MINQLNQILTINLTPIIVSNPISITIDQLRARNKSNAN